MARSTKTTAETLQDELAAVTNVELTLHALLSKADHRRYDRAEAVEVTSATLTEDLSRVSGTVVGTTATYESRITITPRRGFRCTCPDCRDRGHRVGPCKHIIALAEHALEDLCEPKARMVLDAIEVEAFGAPSIPPEG